MKRRTNPFAPAPVMDYVYRLSYFGVPSFLLRRRSS